MAFCSSSFVQYLPEPWRNLENLDNQIIINFIEDYSSVLYFIDYLEMQRTGSQSEYYFPSNEIESPKSPKSLECYAERHATLCHAAVEMLSEKDKEKYGELVKRIGDCKNKKHCYPFFSGYEWAGLPESWRGPEHQEKLMIKYLERKENMEDVVKFLEGLVQSDWLEHSYHRAGLVVGVISYMNGLCLTQELEKIQWSAQSLIRCDEYNSILVRHGCLKGFLAIRGWLCENNPNPQVMLTNFKIDDLNYAKASSTAAQKVEIEDELEKQYDILRQLAKPWRLSPDRQISGLCNNKCEKKDEFVCWEFYSIRIGEDKLTIQFLDVLQLFISRFDAVLFDIGRTKISVCCTLPALEAIKNFLQ